MNTTTTVPTPTPTRLPTPTLTPTKVLTPTPTRIPTPGTTLPPTPTTVVTTKPSPTNTPQPGVTITTGPTLTPNLVLQFDALLHGIGKAGDASSPQSTGNPSPKTQTRQGTLTFYNSANQRVLETQVPLIYNSSKGVFSSSLVLDSKLSQGTYVVKIKTERYLQKEFSQLLTLSSSKTYSLASISLIAGDINGDNQLNILDYNILIGCFSDLQQAVSCTPTNKILADLNDDGNVNQFDYNLFLREIQNQQGS